MRLLAFETSCDETSAAVIGNNRILSNVISSQIEVHSEYGGVVPELATREHLRNLKSVVSEALTKASCDIDDVTAVGATQGPGLPTALMVGWKAAQAFAYSIDKPLIGVNHVVAHLYSPWFSEDQKGKYLDHVEPNISLIVSGGHTMLVKVNGALNHELMGQTKDDAAGECFDKTAKLLGLSYPGGPEIDKFAKGGNPKAYDFARPMLNQENDDFSFSGLKTSVKYFLEKNSSVLFNDDQLPDLCASIQAAIVEVLLVKAMRAAMRTNSKCITISGGVARNSYLRSEFKRECRDRDIVLKIAVPDLCTDNAAMIGLLANLMYEKGDFSNKPDDDIKPNWNIN
tara:strand:+ start:501 stop:1526 length:1026 start_codon:yes stop_codon:yes gene_type:complete